MRGAPVLGPVDGAACGITPAHGGSTPHRPASKGRAGITPAYAGSTAPASWPSGRARDHPRMRGAPALAVKGQTAAGINPAYAGSTARPASYGSSSRDHHRVCGEHKRLSRATVSAEGSPPRMRGARSNDATRSRRGRVTPAYAGSTSRPLLVYRPRRDHHRVCGEHRPASASQNCARGSPPRMRGAPPPTRPSRWPTRDHPCVCGEHSSLLQALVPVIGSPPRVRGAHRQRRAREPCCRITPACAGST